MKVPMSWLKEYVEIDCSIDEYAHLMTMSGSKVEGIEKKGEDIKNVVLGKILSIEKHPDAEKLVVCQVDVGDEKVQIVTGASNVREGNVIPVAKNGSELPGGFKIKKTKLRGVESCGMLCSIHELGITKEQYPSADEDGIFILDSLDIEMKLGRDIRDILGLRENIVEFEITSNRPDCLSVVGLALETAVTLDKEYSIPKVVAEEIGQDAKDYASVEVADPDLCPRYSARVIKNVKIGPSPKWMQDKLRACGVRAINNIVDITNYVMLEYGQPMHAFDLNLLEGKKIIVRKALEGEALHTLDDQERKLDTDMLVIADEEKAVAVAGVMGGGNSEVSEATEMILFESANFLGSSVRLTAKKLGMRTEASARFEKGLDIENTVKSLDRACQLIAQLGAGEVIGGVIDIDNSDKEPRKLKLRPDKINEFLGTRISLEDMAKILEKLKFKVDKQNLEVTVPSFRADVEAEVDIAEEIARIYGYDKIKPTLVTGEITQGGKNYKQGIEDKVKSSLLAQGLSEIITYSFTSPKVFDLINIPKDSKLRSAVQIINPLGEENSIMRTTTLPEMLQVLSRNFNHRTQEVRLFEFGKVYFPKAVPVKELPEEKNVVTLGMYGEVDYYDIKGNVEVVLETLRIKDFEFSPLRDNPSFHPGKTAKLLIGGKEAGVVGEVHPMVTDNYEIETRVFAAVLDFDILLEGANLVPEYRPLPKYPAVTRDIAMLVRDEVLVKQIEDIIRKCSGKLLEQLKLFDVYKGKQIPEGIKSVAYSITFRASDRTLTDDEINKVFDKILSSLKQNLEAELR